MFERKATARLLEWKESYSDKYAVMLEGARRVGKSTIAEEFAKNNYRSYIKIDFANISKEKLSVFDDIAEPDIFFLRLQSAYNVTLYKGESVIIFDEIQRAPNVRQAIKYLVQDGRYNYIETGSLISIRKNVKDIVIPSEEYKIPVYPMDYEEFLWALGKKDTYDLLRELYKSKKPVGNQLNNKLMRDFRIYMAVGGMPQAVSAYIEGNNFEKIDFVKRAIIELYKEDFRKIDNSGRVAMIYDFIPSALSQNRKRYVLSKALNKRISPSDEELLADLLDSKTVLISYNITNPEIALSQSRMLDSYKLYYSDTGLFTTLLFNDERQINREIYNRMLSDKLDANLGYLYENAIAQMINATGRSLYYHTWQKSNSTHYYEIDFLITDGTKIMPFEVKSSSIRNHSSITEFGRKYSSKISRSYMLSQKDAGHEGQLMFRPIYMVPFILEEQK